MIVRILIAVTLCVASIAAYGADGQTDRHQIRDLKITMLSTQVSESVAGLAEWGFAALVEADGRKLLFDTGARPDTVLSNARALGIDLSDVQDVVLSHNHQDHTGGLVHLRRVLMETNPKALSRAYVAPAIFAPRRNEPPYWSSMAEKRRQFEALGGEFVLITAPSEVLPGLWLTGPPPRQHEESSMVLLSEIEVELDGIWQVDAVPEDMPLVALTTDGVFVLTGCGHSGLVNNVLHAQKLTGGEVKGAIGSFHLFLYSDDELRWTADQLKRAGVDVLSAAHCTGIESAMKLRSLMRAARDEVYVSGVGAVFSSGNGGKRPPPARF